MITLSRRTAAAVVTGLTTVTAAVTAGALAMGPVAGAERPDLADGSTTTTVREYSDDAIADLQADADAAAAEQSTTSGAGAGYLGNEATTFVPVAPCRIADTRKSSAGRIAVSSTRDFRVSGDIGFEAQGGTSGGCGIPENAVAIGAALKAVAPAGSGYLKLWGYGEAIPTSTALTYPKGLEVGDATVAALSAPGTDFRLSARPFLSPTHLVIDVTGYYVLNDHGLITPEGGLAAGGATLWGIWRGEGTPTTGFYALAVDHDLEFCSYVVTPWDSDVVASATMSDTYINEFFVYLQDRETGAPKDGAFYYSVTC
ncbi:hypothetical protein [Agromyces binzhouensis]|uniref:Uncharacterized protein n=1 Tax=Agromyces binzhouensis TaxID=1817495 RepID=A0A4Q2JSD0_9MICO|nr:hypothetical protein [Agromyces binzhouensis]RXZ50124.1 hypothetical protein ESO86_03615 [Agromyces binzhouensis]